MSELIEFSFHRCELSEKSIKSMGMIRVAGIYDLLLIWGQGENIKRLNGKDIWHVSIA